MVALLPQAEALTPAGRRELAERLLREDAAADPRLSDAMTAEPDRRMAGSDANPGSGIPWETVYAATMKSLGQ